MTQEQEEQQGISPGSDVGARLDELREQVIDALTEAAMLGVPWGRRVDVAELVCQAVTAAAANTGDIDVFLSGRPGSWEAGLVRLLITKTAGEDEAALASHRTHPIRVTLEPSTLLDEAGLSEVLDSEIKPLADRIAAAWQSVEDLLEAPTGPADPRLTTQQQAEVTAGLPIRVARHGLSDAERERVTDVEDEVDHVQDVIGELEDLYTVDTVRYRNALAATADAVLAEQRRQHPELADMPIEVVVSDAVPGAAWDTSSWGGWDEVMEQIQADTVARTPIPPGVPHADRDRLAQILAETGRTYSARRAAGEEPSVWTQIDTDGDQ